MLELGERSRLLLKTFASGLYFKWFSGVKVVPHCFDHDLATKGLMILGQKDLTHAPS